MFVTTWNNNGEFQRVLELKVVSTRLSCCCMNLVKKSVGFNHFEDCLVACCRDGRRLMSKACQTISINMDPSFLGLLFLPHQYALASAPPGPAHHASLGAASASFIAPGKDGFVPCVPTKKMIPRIILAHEKSCSGCSSFGPGF